MRRRPCRSAGLAAGEAEVASIEGLESMGGETIDGEWSP